VAPLALPRDENLCNSVVRHKTLCVVDVSDDGATALDKVANFVCGCRAFYVPVQLVLDFGAKVDLPIGTREVNLAQSTLSVDFNRQVLFLKCGVALSSE
jgi:hypothetical protein